MPPCNFSKHINFALSRLPGAVARACSGFSRRVKNGLFFAIFLLFQLRSSGYAPSKTQKLTKNQPVFANGRDT
jgi:hypothetical protein